MPRSTRRLALAAALVAVPAFALYTQLPHPTAVSATGLAAPADPLAVDSAESEPVVVSEEAPAVAVAEQP